MQDPLDTPVTPPSSPAAWERDTLEKLAFATLREQQVARRWKLAGCVWQQA